MATLNDARRVAAAQNKKRGGRRASAPASRKKAGPPAEVTAERTFWSPFGDVIRVEHPDGSVANVGEQPRPLPKKLWRAAVKAGCSTSTDIRKADLTGLDAGDDPFTRVGRMKEVILAALESDENDPRYADAFDAHDKPSLRWLEKECGFPISSTERDSAWDEVQKEIPDEESPEDDDNDNDGDGADEVEGSGKGDSASA